mgnify:FL=1
MLVPGLLALYKGPIVLTNNWYISFFLQYIWDLRRVVIRYTLLRNTVSKLVCKFYNSVAGYIAACHASIQVYGIHVGFLGYIKHEIFTL